MSADHTFSFQERVHQWATECFGPIISNDKVERTFRFLEEALELGQAVGCTKEQAIALVEYVYNRPPGEPWQEIGGSIVTLAVLAQALGYSMATAGEVELGRVRQPAIMQKVRRKQAAKRGVVSHAAQEALPGEWNE